jgi:hypothetical protein
MDLRELPRHWTNLDIWNQLGIILGFLGIILSSLPIAGVQMPIFSFSAFSSVVLLIGICLLVVGNIKQSGKLEIAKQALGELDGRIERATAAVYAQKKKEIDHLEMEVAAWKDRFAESREDLGKTNQLLENERGEFRAQREELVSSCDWLLDELVKCVKETPQAGAHFFHVSDEVKRKMETSYQMAGSMKDNRTPDGKRFSEIESMLKKYRS